MNAQTKAPAVAPLAWEYQDHSSRPEYRATYRGFVIRAVQDQSPENPFGAWDCEPPTLIYRGRDGFDDYSGDTVADPLAAMSDGIISRHWRAIAKALDLKEEEHDSQVKEAVADIRAGAAAYLSPPKTRTAPVRRELFEEALEDAKHGNGSDYLETLAALWRISGAVAETWASNGYSQGDWAEGLSVATPEWAAKVGAPRSTHSDQCKYAGKLYGYWAWGDVYGFIIGEDDDDGDSCWGFYGDDFRESGLEEAARGSVDAVIRNRKRQAKAADLIKARVPLHLRPALLDAAGQVTG